MKTLVGRVFLAWCLGACAFAAASAAGSDPVAASTIPPAIRMQPAELAAALQNPAASRPLILQVGFRTLFDQGHIPGAQYAGAGSQPDGLRALRARVASLPKDTAIVIYCGCCPWSHCPNVGAAFAELRRLGFDQVRVLYIANDFGSDWIDKGYPVTPGA